MGQVHATQEQLTAMAQRCGDTGQNVSQGMNRLLGQTTTNARPITLSIGTGPWQAVRWGETVRSAGRLWLYAHGATLDLPDGRVVRVLGRKAQDDEF